MGAWFTEQTAAGKTPAEAYQRAVADASAEYGHQEGYSGALNSKHGGFVLVELPPRFTYRKLQSLLEDLSETHDEYLRELVADAKRDVAARRRGAKGQLRTLEIALRREEARIARLRKQIPPSLAARFDGLCGVYHDKWGACLAVELKGAEQKRYRGSKRRGEKIYIFFGYAPS